MTAGRNASEGESIHSGAPHIPVLLHQVVAALAPTDGEGYIDGTFGAGGYTRAILAAAQCRILGLDRDPDAVAGAVPLLAQSAGRLTVREAPFSTSEQAWKASGLPGRPHGIVLDLGVSSMQLDRPERGFSFSADGPLDMRMGAHGETAADLINRRSEAEIADILYRYGEERRSRAIARAIVARRSDQPLARTGELARLIEGVLGRKPGDKKHPATRSFQALRIAVNGELEELEQGLAAAERLLAPGGRLVVVTFHSLEDRMVKDFLRERTGHTPRGSRHGPSADAGVPEPSFRFVNQRPISPSEDEIAANPRARSARLRAAVRTLAPAWTPASEGRR